MSTTDALQGSGSHAWARAVLIREMEKLRNDAREKALDELPDHWSVTSNREWLW